MFRPLRRTEFCLDPPQAEELLKTGVYGVLATLGSDGYPYGVPLNYVYLDKSIYFHGCPTGHKSENLAYEKKVSFTVVGAVQLVPSEPATNYESVVVFGRAHPVGGEEKLAALRALVQKYAPAYTAKGEQLIQAHLDVTQVVKIEIQRVSGKSRRKD